MLASAKDKSLGTSHPATTCNSKQECSEIDSLIKQFGEMKILLAEAVTKVNRLEKKAKTKHTLYYPATTTSNSKQVSSEIDGLIKHFREIKILLGSYLTFFIEKQLVTFFFNEAIFFFL